MISKTLALFIGGLLAAVSADEAVVTLTSKNFDSFIKENPLALVEFYAPWCGHCKKLAPEYEDAAQELKKREDGVPLGKVDATEEKDLATKFGVRGFPTIKFFRNGNAEEYSGGRTKSTIIEWIDMMTGPATSVVESIAEVEKLAKEGIVFAATVSAKDNEAHKTFEKVADSNRLYGKFVVVVAESHSDEVSVYRNDESPATAKIDDSEKLASWMKEERFPLFGAVGAENYQAYTDRAKDFVWFAGKQEDYDAVAKEVRASAVEFRSHSFVWLDTEKYGAHAEGLIGVSEFPAVVLATKSGRFVFPEKAVKTETLTSFIKEALAGKIEKTLKSEPIPEKNDEAVKVVVGKNFEEMVLQKDKDVMLEVYAPWCGHCKKLAPEYDSFAEKLKDATHIVVAKMDGTQNEAPVENFEWQGFPTLFFVKAGETKPMPFDGARTEAGLIEFVKKHSSKPVDVEAPEEKKDEL